MIEGLQIRCNVGAVEIVRSPFVQLTYKRRAVLSRGIVHIPDIEGKVRATLKPGQSMIVRFGYRGQQNFWHTWKGTIENIDQPEAHSANPDAIIVRGVGLENALCTTTITETFQEETGRAMAKRLLARTGLPVGELTIPEDVLPHQIFSNVTIARALKQLEHSLQRAFGHDLSKHAVWLGEQGLMWSDGDEPGAVFQIATSKNLLDHTPPARAGEMGIISSILLPGLTDSRQVRIEDSRRGIRTLERAEEVIHTLQRSGNITAISYGCQAGWGG